MRDIFSAMFEGGLLVQAGVPVREMLDHVQAAYKDSSEVTQLFDDLKKDWDQPTRSPNDDDRMVAPFKKRETKRPDFLIAATFGEMAGMASMVDGFWKNAGFTYVLKNHIMRVKPKADDLKFGRELFGFIPPDYALIDYLFSLAPDTEWNKRNFAASTATISFADWVKSSWPKMSPPGPFRCRKAAEDACLKAGNIELITQLQTEWDQFASLLIDG